MHNAFQVENLDFLKKIFPELKLTPEIKEKIKNIVFFGYEFSKGFKVQKGTFLKKFRENNISVPGSVSLPLKEFILSDSEARAIEVGLP